MTVALVFAAAGLAFACALLLVAALARGFQRLAAHRFPMGDASSGGREGTMARLMRNGIVALKPLSRWVLRAAPMRKYCTDVSEWMRSRGSFCPVDAVTTLLIALLAVLGLAGTLVARNPVGGIAADALLLVVFAARVQAWRDEERERLRDGVPAALSVMGECFQSGYSLMQTMGEVAGQSEGELKAIFARCENVLKLGGTSAEALAHLKGEEAVSELSFVAVALDVQHQAGGSIASVLGNAQQMVADEIELRRSMRVQTAQARLSARVVCVMPFILIAVLSLLSDGFLSAFFESPAGIVMLAIALVMEVAGVMLVRRMLKVAD